MVSESVFNFANDISYMATFTNNKGVASYLASCGESTMPTAALNQNSSLSFGQPATSIGGIGADVAKGNLLG